MVITANPPMGWESRPCVGTDEELWFGPADGDWPDREPESTTDRRRREAAGKRICSGCSAVEFCLSSELQRPITHQWGTRGGMSQDERRELIRLRMRVAAVARRRGMGSRRPVVRRGVVRFPSTIRPRISSHSAVGVEDSKAVAA